jgi:hypothetical protein
MPGFVIPFDYAFLDPDPRGPIRRRVRTLLTVEVQTGPDSFTELRDVRIDTGATYTLMSATLARASGIPFPPETSLLDLTTVGGARLGRVHDGELRVRFPRLPGRLFRLYCVFAEEILPSTPLVFGLNDFLDEFRLTFDGTTTADAVFGSVRLDAAYPTPP